MSSFCHFKSYSNVLFCRIFHLHTNWHKNVAYFNINRKFFTDILAYFFNNDLDSREYLLHDESFFTRPVYIFQC